MSFRRFPTDRLGPERPSPWLGLLVAAALIAVETLAIYPLKTVAPVVSLSVVYVPAVLLLSSYWGLWLGLLTSVVSAAAFNFFHIPPTGHFTIANSRNWVALAAFVLIATVLAVVAGLARARAVEADRGRAEADLAAALARELLAGTRTQAALGSSAHRIAQALGLSSAAIELAAVPPSERRLALPLRSPGGEQIATLLVPRQLPEEIHRRLTEHVVPALEALVAIALHRDAVQSEAVESAALRRSDELKTALLRAVSHDLRTPLTAIVTAGHALGTSALTHEERTQLSAAVVEEGERLSALIDKLLDLSRLQAGRAEPRRDWASVEEILLAVQDALPIGAGRIRVSVEPDVPPVRVDAAQLERALANLVENALRYSGELPVSVQVRRTDARVQIRVVDQGPGISPTEQERIFEPFYRGSKGGERSVGAGLGLAIAKGFVEANGGTISVHSLPGQSTSFVVSLPVVEAAPAPVRR